MDSGSNIILTNDISLLRELQDITPFTISVALNGESTLDDYCTKQGLLTLTRDDGRHFDVTCYSCPNATETIISPQAIITESPIFTKWTQVGYKDPTMPGKVQFFQHQRHSHYDNLIDMQQRSLLLSLGQI